MVQISRAAPWIHRLWPWGRHVGNWLHNGWAIRWLASIPRRFWNGLALPYLESAWAFNKRADGVLQQEHQIRRTQIPWNHQTWDSREAIHDQSVKESPLAHDRSPQNGPCGKTDRRVGPQASLLRWHSRARSWRGTDKFDCSSVEANLLVLVAHYQLRYQIWHNLHAGPAYPARHRSWQPASKRVGKWNLNYSHCICIWSSACLLSPLPFLFLKGVWSRFEKVWCSILNLNYFFFHLRWLIVKTCKERTPAPNKHHGPQSTSSGTNQSNGAANNGQNLFSNQSHFKMHMTGIEQFNLPNKCKLPQAISFQLQFLKSENCKLSNHH